MKKTLSILLSIITLLSVFILPTSVSADENFDEVDTKNAIAVTVNETQYKESDLTFTKEEPMRTYKITAEEAGVYRFYANSSEIVGMKAYLFKPNNLNPTEYIKSSSMNKETRKGGFDITYYLAKNETVYLKVALRDVYYYAGRKFDFVIGKKKDLIAKNGCIYESRFDRYFVVDNYINKYQSLTIDNKINNLPVAGVDEDAFRNCRFITSVNIPSECKTLHTYCFDGCYNLKSVKLAEGVEELKYYAFQGTQIEAIYLPKSIESPNALEAMLNLKTITVAKDNPYYTAVNGVLFTKDKKKLVRYPARGPRTYTIPNGVETVCDSAFEDSYVEKVYFPNTVKKMIGDVFHYCERLKYVKLNEGITSIGSCAFQGCESLSYINIPSTVKDIGLCAINDAGIRSIEIPENVFKIDGYSIYNCKYLDAIVFKGKRTEISTDAFRKMDVKTVYGPKGSTAEKYAEEKGINFVSTTLEDGEKCTQHHYIETECTKIPDCMNYGIFKTKCAICGKAGSNKKEPSLNHNFADEVCKFCGVSTTKYVNADFNKTYSEIVPIPVSSLVIERNIIFNASKDGKYFFNISNLSDKVLIDATIMKNDIRNIHYVTECANKSFKKSYMLSKGDQLKIRIRGLNSTGEYYNQSTYKYYEPIKFNFKVTCDHIYKNTVVKPTCVSGGYSLHKCSTCGYSYKDKKTAKLKLQKPNGLTVKSGKKSLTVSYKKVAKATGYQIQYSLYSNFKSVKTIKLTKNSITKKTITKLKRNKKYFVRIRSYVVQNKKTTYSSWTKSKNAKTK